MIGDDDVSFVNESKNHAYFIYEFRLLEDEREKTKISNEIRFSFWDKHVSLNDLNIIVIRYLLLLFITGSNHMMTTPLVRTTI